MASSAKLKLHMSPNGIICLVRLTGTGTESLIDWNTPPTFEASWAKGALKEAARAGRVALKAVPVVAPKAVRVVANSDPGKVRQA